VARHGIPPSLVPLPGSHVLRGRASLERAHPDGRRRVRELGLRRLGRRALLIRETHTRPSTRPAASGALGLCVCDARACASLCEHVPALRVVRARACVNVMAASVTAVLTQLDQRVFDVLDAMPLPSARAALEEVRTIVPKHPLATRAHRHAFRPPSAVAPRPSPAPADALRRTDASSRAGRSLVLVSEWSAPPDQAPWVRTVCRTAADRSDAGLHMQSAQRAQRPGVYHRRHAETQADVNRARATAVATQCDVAHGATRYRLTRNLYDSSCRSAPAAQR
jgi:hypothetical protein